MNLRQLVDQLLVNISYPVFKRINIINEIDALLYAGIGEEKIQQVVRSLLNDAVRHSKSKVIYIFAKSFHNVTVLHIKYDDPRKEPAIEKNFGEIKKLAGMLGGCVYINTGKITGTTIAFTFLSHQLAVVA